MEKLAEHPEVYDWLRDRRGLSVETIAEASLGFDDGKLFADLRSQSFNAGDIMASGLVVDGRGGSPVDFLEGCVTIPYKTAHNVVNIRGRVFEHKAGEGPKYKTTRGAKSRLYNTDVTWHTKDLWIAEGEFDALLLTQMGFPAVAVPGANTWQDQWDGYLSLVDHVYLAFDGDDAGRKGASKLKDRFGGKVRELVFPAEDGDEIPDVTDFVVKWGHTSDELTQLVDDARSGGLLLSVDDCFKEHQEVQSQTGIQFGVEKLDLILKPGLLPGQVLVVLAKSGSGSVSNVSSSSLTRTPSTAGLIASDPAAPLSAHRSTRNSMFTWPRQGIGGVCTEGHASMEPARWSHRRVTSIS